MDKTFDNHGQRLFKAPKRNLGQPTHPKPLNLKPNLCKTQQTPQRFEIRSFVPKA